MTTPQHHPQRADVTPGFEPPCEPWCESRGRCVTCGVEVCPEHDEGAVIACPEGGFHHRDDCADGCTPCALLDRDDRMAELGHAMWKGEL